MAAYSGKSLLYVSVFVCFPIVFWVLFPFQWTFCITPRIFFFLYSSFMFVVLFYFQSKRFSHSTFLSFRCSLLLAHFISKTWSAVITFNFCVMEIAPLMSKMIEFILWSFWSSFIFLPVVFTLEQHRRHQKSTYKFWFSTNLTINSLVLIGSLTDNINSWLKHVLYFIYVIYCSPTIKIEKRTY